MSSWSANRNLRAKVKRAGPSSRVPIELQSLDSDLMRRDLSLIPSCREGQIGDDEEDQQYQWGERYWAVSGKIVRKKGRDPCECESGISPFFKFSHATYEQRDSPKRFGDPQNNPQLLRISQVRESLNPAAQAAGTPGFDSSPGAHRFGRFCRHLVFTSIRSGHGGARHGPGAGVAGFA